MDLRGHAWKLIGTLLITIIVSIVIFRHFFTNSPEQPFLWRQEAVFGFDNFGTATYKDGILYAPSKGNSLVYAINASDGNIIWSYGVRQCDTSPCIDGNVIYVGECSSPDGEPTPLPKAIALNSLFRFVCLCVSVRV